MEGAGFRVWVHTKNGSLEVARLGCHQGSESACEHNAPVSPKPLPSMFTDLAAAAPGVVAATVVSSRVADAAAVLLLLLRPGSKPTNCLPCDLLIRPLSKGQKLD